MPRTINKPKKQKKALSLIYSCGVGTTLKKPGTDKTLVVMETTVPLKLERDYLLMWLETGRLHHKRFTPKQLDVLGYQIDGKLDENILEELNSRPSTTRKRRRKKREPKAHPDKCGGGMMFPLEDCEIVKGENPLKRGASMKLKGRTVVGLKAKCPECGRRARVKFYHHDKTYKLARHTAKITKEKTIKAIKPKRKKRKRSRRTT